MFSVVKGNVNKVNSRCHFTFFSSWPRTQHLPDGCFLTDTWLPPGWPWPPSWRSAHLIIASLLKFPNRAGWGLEINMRYVTAPLTGENGPSRGTCERARLTLHSWCLKRAIGWEGGWGGTSDCWGHKVNSFNMHVQSCGCYEQLLLHLMTIRWKYVLLCTRVMLVNSRRRREWIICFNNKHLPLGNPGHIGKYSMVPGLNWSRQSGFETIRGININGKCQRKVVHHQTTV